MWYFKFWMYVHNWGTCFVSPLRNATCRRVKVYTIHTQKQDSTCRRTVLKTCTLWTLCQSFNSPSYHLCLFSYSFLTSLLLLSTFCPVYFLPYFLSLIFSLWPLPFCFLQSFLCFFPSVFFILLPHFSNILNLFFHERPSFTPIQKNR
jgi:hypothetical protein